MSAGTRSPRAGTDAATLFGLTGKSILITGATGALGSAAARALGRMGARLTLVGGNGPKLDAVAAEIASPGEVIPQPLTSLADGVGLCVRANR
jgi:NAD(P)-dependent dehydrogenase (short-subunit alcohol dehydrogenase family)